MKAAAMKPQKNTDLFQRRLISKFLVSRDISNFRIGSQTGSFSVVIGLFS